MDKTLDYINKLVEKSNGYANVFFVAKVTNIKWLKNNGNYCGFGVLFRYDVVKKRWNVSNLYQPADDLHYDNLLSLITGLGLTTIEVDQIEAIGEHSQDSILFQRLGDEFENVNSRKTPTMSADKALEYIKNEKNSNN